MAKTVKVAVEEQITSSNDQIAAANRAKLAEAGVFSINLMASPGGGKTSLILRTVKALKGEMRLAAVDGDVVMVDVEKIAAQGIPVELVNTGGDCHLQAHMIANVLPKFDLESIDMLIIENVGNLICPAAWNLGADKKVVIASVPEGDDKPYKYPAMFRGADVLLLNKIDYLAVQDFDVEYFKRGVEALNNDVAFFPVSCRTGEGLDAWFDWVRGQVQRKKA
ncbi:MAG: hydrogenase nickel incorporation protein HypB [Anaerolineae bacterium]|nr:hydrogenase nickel incorporation protein HypB [Anaerolineae bacterium]